MKRVTRNTLTVWLITLGVVLILTFFAFLASGDILMLFLFPILVGMLAVPAAVAVTGVKAARGTGSFAAGMTAAVVSAFLLYLGTTDGLQLLEFYYFLLSLAPLAIFLLAFGIERLRIYLRDAGHTAAYQAACSMAVVLCLLGVYLLCAFQSTMAYSLFPSDLFFIQPANDVASVGILNCESVMRNEDGSLFTGTITSYKRKLALDFTGKRASGLAYYIDGLLFGETGDVLPQGQYNSGYGSYAGTHNWSYDDPNRAAVKTVLLHRDYESILRQDLSQGSLVYYEEIPQNAGGVYDPYPLPKAVAVFKWGDRMERKEIYFNSNGVVQRIETNVCDQKGWNENWSMKGFDSLGFQNDLAANIKWKKDDFVLTDFSGYEMVKELPQKLVEQPPFVEKMEYVSVPENWKHENNFDNLIAVHNMPLTTVYFYIKTQGTWQGMSAGDAASLSELIARSPIVVNYLDDSWSIYDFQSESIAFKIEGEDSDSEILLYYRDGKILVDNGPYYFDLVQNGGEQDGESLRIRTKLYNRLLDTIKEYTGQVIPATDQRGLS